jgi:hypothetical protein
MLLVEFFNSPEGDSSAKFTSTPPTTESQCSHKKASKRRMVGSTAKAISVKENTKGIDTITVDVPLMIRLLEYAREDAQTDMDLHHVAERLIALSQSGQPLSMQDYNKICNTKESN